MLVGGLEASWQGQKRYIFHKEVYAKQEAPDFYDGKNVSYIFIAMKLWNKSETFFIAPISERSCCPMPR